MKKIFWFIIDSLIIMILLILIIISYEEAKLQALLRGDQYTPINLEVRLVRVNMISNHSVGNSWDTGFKVNGVFLHEGESTVLSPYIDDEITLIAGAKELDNYPDVGVYEQNVKVSDLDFGEKNFITLKVGVRENRGRYTGNYAVWEFELSMERQIKFKDIFMEFRNL